MLIILTAVIIIILLLLSLLFKALITLVLTEKGVCVPVKKCTTHLANRSVHSYIY